MSHSILIFSEDNKLLSEALYVANKLGKGNSTLVALTNYEDKKDEFYKGFDEVYLAKGNLLPDQWSSLLAKLIEEKNVSHIVAPHTINNNDILSFVSEKKGIYMFSNVFSLQEKENSYTLSRQVIGGRGISNIEVRKDEKFALTVPIKVYPKVDLEKSPVIKEISEIPVSKLKIVGFEERVRSGVSIESADVVVGIGRGFRNKEDIKLAQELAEVLNGVIGCSRPIAADYGWLPNDLWIGISSKTIRPNLYIAVGISGAPQHVAGIMDSKVIVAINKDKNASIFKYADYGVVADLYQFLPILTRKLKEIKR